MNQSKSKNKSATVVINKQSSSKKSCTQKKEESLLLANKIKTFEINKAVTNWWSNAPETARFAFFSALIIGFVSHLFVYTGRYYGLDDMGIIRRLGSTVSSGRWFNTVITGLSYGYILPLISGVFVTLFLAVSAFYVCKLFYIQKKFNAILISGLLSTFPSIANTNLFLYDTSNYHFAVLLGILAVYVTVKFKFGFLPGSIFAMLTLAIYQSKFNIVLTLSLFYLIAYLLDESFNFKGLMKDTASITSMICLSVTIYAISLPISFRNHNTTFNNYRGFSFESMLDRLFSISGLRSALGSTYKGFYDGFFGNIYFMTSNLKQAHAIIALLSLLFLFYIISSKKIHKEYSRLLIIAIMIILVPFASNFSNFFDTGNAYGLMIYAFVLTPVFMIVISERCSNIFPIWKSIFTICMLLVIGNYIIGNNIYYLKAHYFNLRTFSLTTRILTRIDPLIPLSNSKHVTFFGGLPNEYYPESSNVFREYGNIRDGSALGMSSYINYGTPSNYSLTLFAKNIDNMHGVNLKPLNWGGKWDHLASEVLQQNMPAWPAEGSVGIIDDVIVVNFGLADVVLESDESGHFFRARHWVSEGHRQHNYEYHWQVYRNGAQIDSAITNNARLYFDVPNTEDIYRIIVTIRNTSAGYSYPNAAIELVSPGGDSDSNVSSIPANSK